MDVVLLWHYRTLRRIVQQKRTRKSMCYLHEFGKRRVTSVSHDFVVAQDETRRIVADTRHLSTIHLLT